MGLSASTELLVIAKLLICHAYTDWFVDRST